MPRADYNKNKNIQIVLVCGRFYKVKLFEENHEL